jgi:antitoxin CptB
LTDAAPDAYLDTASDTSLGRLSWRCRRGMKELDVMLQRWLKHRYPQASMQERIEFDRFLDLPDPELLGYLVRGDDPSEPVHARLTQEIRSAAR